MNKDKLKEEIKNSGITAKEVSETLGIDESTFYRKMARSKKTFSVEEAAKIVNLLSISNNIACDIFLT